MWGVNNMMHQAFTIAVFNRRVRDSIVCACLETHLGIYPIIISRIITLISFKRYLEYMKSFVYFDYV